MEQAEKLRIIRSHMDSLELCKADLDSLILTIAEKYLPQLNLVMTALGIQAFATHLLNWRGYVRFFHLEAFLLLGWAYNESAGKKENHQEQPGWGIHQAPVGAVCALCYPGKAVPRSPQSLSSFEEALW